MISQELRDTLYEQRHWWAMGVLLLVQFVFVIAYLNHEQTVHFWDYAMYYDWARELAGLWQRDGIAAAWDRFRGSLSEDYALFFALPSMASFALFGDSRLVFILTNFVVFVLGWQWAMALLLRRIFMVQKRVALFWAMAAVCCMPVFWVPLLGGFPDHVAALFIVLALVLVAGQKRDWRYMLLLTATLAAAILLRRHYVYPAMAVMLAAALLDSARVVMPLLRSQMSRRQLVLPVHWLMDLLRVGLRYLLAGVGVIALLFLVAPDFLQKLLTIDFTTLYQAYSTPAGRYIGITLERFGLLFTVAAVTGYVLLWLRLPYLRTNLLLLAVAAVISLMLFAFGPAHAGPHYMLHLLPVVAVVGLVGLYQALRGLPFWFSRISLVLVGVVLAGNSAWALWLAPETIRPQTGQEASILFSTPNPPERRSDLPELVALADYLIAKTNDQDKILLVGSSHIINQDLLSRILVERPGGVDVIRRMVFAPEVDGRGLPLAAYAMANLYIVPDKPQYHLDPAGQTVVTAMANRFPPPRPLLKSFMMDDRKFKLDGRVRLDIWRHRGWQPELLANNLKQIQETLRSDELWVPLMGGAKTLASRYTDGSFSYLYAALDAQSRRSEFFLVEPKKGGRYRFQGEIHFSENCPLPTLSLAARGRNGKVLIERLFRPIVNNGLLYQVFTVPLMTEVAYVYLSVVQPDIGRDRTCWVQLSDVDIRPF